MAAIKCNTQSIDKRNFHEIGITYAGFGNSSIVSTGLDGAPSYESENQTTYGINYVFSNRKWLEFETGFEYSKYTLRVEPNVGSGIPVNFSFINTEILTLPIMLRAVYKNIFFVNAGGFLGLQINKLQSPDDQSGLGFVAGIGAKYAINNKIIVMVNP